MNDNPPHHHRRAHAARNQRDELPDRVQVGAAYLLHAVLANQVLDRHGRQHQQARRQHQQRELDARPALPLARVRREAALEARPEARYEEVQPVPEEGDAGDEPEHGQDLAQHAEPAVKCGAPEKGNLLAAAAVPDAHDIDAREPEPAAVGGQGRVEEEPRGAGQRVEVADAVAGDAGEGAAEQELRDDGGGRVRRGRGRGGVCALGAETDEDGELDDEVGGAQAGLAARLKDGRQKGRDPLGV